MSFRPTSKGLQPTTTSNISAGAAATISNGQRARLWAVINTSAATLYVRMGGDATSPAATTPDKYDDLVPVGTTKYFNFEVDSLSIYNSGGSTATYNTDFSVHIWP